MFLLFNGKLINQACIKRIERVIDESPEKIIYSINIDGMEFEYFKTKEAMNLRFNKIKEALGVDAWQM